MTAAGAWLDEVPWNAHGLVSAIAQDAGGSSGRMDQDNRYLEIADSVMPGLV